MSEKRYFIVLILIIVSLVLIALGIKRRNG